MEDNLFLCFIKKVGEDIDGNNIYELLFTEDIETFFGENFEYKPCCLCNELIPFEDTYSVVKTIKIKMKLDLIQESCCFSFGDCQDGIVAIAYENIDDYEEYPENGRLIFHYGESYNDIEKKLAEINILME